MVEVIKADIDVYASVLHLVSLSVKSLKNPVHPLNYEINVSPRYMIIVDGSFYTERAHAGWGFVIYTTKCCKLYP